MIRAICLNPVIDRTYFIDGFCPGKQYRDNIPMERVGGKGLNVARICSQLGSDTSVYGFVAGQTGRQIRAKMESLCKGAYFVEVQGESRITINLVDNLVRSETEILERGPSAQPQDVEKLLSQLDNDIRAGDIVICAGISIPGAPDDIYARISHLCKAKDAMCFLDTSGHDLKNALPGSYFMAKPNQQEMEDWIGAGALENTDEICAHARKAMLDHFEYLLISRGALGGILVGTDICYHAAVPPVPVLSTIGSGDAAMAGFASAIQKEWSLQEAFRLSMACGVANSIHKNVAELTLQEVEALMEKIQIFPVYPEETYCALAPFGANK
jgi:tagatose 6-phosphate kinase